MATVLIVCTGNICRSPLGAQLLRHRLGDPRVLVTSAGTRCPLDAPMTEEAMRLAAVFGIPEGDSARHRSRRLDEGLVHAADLVLTMTRAHRHDVAELVPSRIRSTFTVREFARIARAVPRETLVGAVRADGADPASRVRAIGHRLADERGIVPGPERPDADDVVDPYGRSWETYRRSAAQLHPAIGAVADLVGAVIAP